MARQRGWGIVLRIEDLDTPRVKPGVIDLTIDLLAWLGIDWDEGPLIQSHEPGPHLAAMHALAGQELIYPCELSRAQIEAAASAPQEGAHDTPFPASLRPATRPAMFTDDAASWRFVVGEEPVMLTDQFRGPQILHPARTAGDFIVWTRRDGAKPGQPAYQLAVVVDDARQGVTHVVRGDDLLDSAARQVLLYRALDLGEAPEYYHLPLVRGVDGRRLAKRHGDTRLDHYRARGVPPERVIGLIAYWNGTIPSPRPLTIDEFRGAFDLGTIPRSDVVFGPENDAWLFQKS
jgi:glutamyl-tRNA synthetase